LQGIGFEGLAAPDANDIAGFLKMVDQPTRPSGGQFALDVVTVE